MRGYRVVLVAAVVFVFPPLAMAGVVIDLVPDNPGPYYGGESLTVDVYLNNATATSSLLEYIRFDFTDTDPAITLGSEFTFDYSAMSASVNLFQGDAALPLPWTVMAALCACPAYFILLPEDDSIRIGSFGLELPSYEGPYVVDLVNRDVDNDDLGAEIRAFPYPYFIDREYWRANSGDIAGGSHGFTVIPEPSLICLLGFGAFLGLRRRRDWRRHSNLAAGYGVKVLFLGVVLVVSPGAFGQPAEIPTETVVVNMDSGIVSAGGSGNTPVVVFSQNVGSAGAYWIRLHFSQVVLSGSSTSGDGSFLRLTSLEEGTVEVLGSDELGISGNTSSGLNGDTILLELLAYPGTGDNRVVVDELLAGVDGEVGGGVAATCGPTDDRVRSHDPRVGRLMFKNAEFNYTAACTAFLVNNRTNDLLTAGHCCADFDWNEWFKPVVEFNTPDSTRFGVIQRAAPEDHYYVDRDSLQFGESAPGEDWCYLGVFDNTQTSWSPLAAQGASFRLPESVPAPSGEMLRVTGYGLDDSPHEHNNAQQVASGSYVGLAGTEVRHTADADTGNSGGPIEDICTEFVYGILTYGFCGNSADFNAGTATDFDLLKTALANPLGICADPQDCNGNGINDDCDINCAAPGCDPPCGASADCGGSGVQVLRGHPLWRRSRGACQHFAGSGTGFCISGCCQDC